MQKYGQKTPPPVDLSKITTVPVAMFVGLVDDLGDPADNRWARSQIGGNVKFYQEYSLGHSSFMVAKDMSYFDDVFTVLDQY